MYCKFNKCKFHENSVNFLKFTVFFTNINMQKNRMFIVRDWFVSKFHQNVQKFIKFANFYRRFVKTFFWIVVDFINLLKKDVKNKFSIKFVMNAETFKFFQNFKNVFTTTFILRHFVVFFFILIETNSSKYAFSKIIFQLFEKKQ